MEKVNRKKLKIIKCGKGSMYLGEVFNEKCHGRGTYKIIKGSLYFRTEGFIKVNLKIMLGKAKDYMYNLMALGTLENSQMIKKMVVE